MKKNNQILSTSKSVIISYTIIIHDVIIIVFHSVPPWCWVVAIFLRHSINQPVTSRGNATLGTIGQRKAADPSRGSVGRQGEEQEVEQRGRQSGRQTRESRSGTTATSDFHHFSLLCSASSAAAPHCRAVTWLRGRSPGCNHRSLRTEAEGTLGNLTSANKHAARIKCIWCWFWNWVWIWKTPALGLFLETHCDLTSLMQFTTKCNHTHP